MAELRLTARIAFADGTANGRKQADVPDRESADALVEQWKGGGYNHFTLYDDGVVIWGEEPTFPTKKARRSRG